MPYLLKPNIISEPLVAQWYAWCYLVAPAPAALSFSNHKLPLLESYVRSPKEHENALKSGFLKGGAFLDAEGHNYVSQAMKLISNTKKQAADLIKFSDLLQELNRFLENECTSANSMTTLYEKIPDELKGYVELLYDLNNRASFRLLEPLIYKSKFYNPELQSVKLFMGNVDKRPFTLSTPRFFSSDDIHIKKPFSDIIYDRIFKTNFEPIGIKELSQLIEESEVNNPNVFLSFFQEVSGIYKKNNLLNDKKNFSVKYFGHATLLIQCGKINILVDPLISNDNSNIGLDRFSYKDIPEKIDFVVITHAHLDHLSLESLLKIRYKIDTIIVPTCSRGGLQDPSMKLFLNYCGFKNVIEMNELEVIDFDEGYIKGIPFFGEHADLDIAKLAYSIYYRSKTIICMADSDNLAPELYRYIKKDLNTIDAVFLGMECEGAPLTWLYGSLMMKSLSRKANQSRRLNGSDCKRAYSLINALETKKVYIYAMGAEPWINYISSVHYNEYSKQIVESNNLIIQCEKNGIFAKRLYGKDILEI